MNLSIENIVANYKKCPKCLNTKLKTDFYHRRSECKTCLKSASNLFYKKKLEHKKSLLPILQENPIENRDLENRDLENRDLENPIENEITTSPINYSKFL